MDLKKLYTLGSVLGKAIEPAVRSQAEIELEVERENEIRRN